jgi:hypothetical protein
MGVDMPVRGHQPGANDQPQNPTPGSTRPHTSGRRHRDHRCPHAGACTGTPTGLQRRHRLLPVRPPQLCAGSQAHAANLLPGERAAFAGPTSGRRESAGGYLAV